MSGWDYFKKCITTDYANFNGRARRSEYWFFVLFSMIFFLAVVFIMSMLGASIFSMASGEFDDGLGVMGFAMIGIFVLLFLAFLIPAIAVAVRRLHDTNKSGWFYLIGLVPYIGAIVMLVFYCTEGTKGENQYGSDPKSSSEDITNQLV